MKRKILFVTAHSFDSKPVGISKEINTIIRIKADLNENLRALDDYEFIPASDVNETDFLDILKKLDPFILHFSGHGDERGNPLLFNRFTIEPAFFSKLLKNINGLECLILNSCNSTKVVKDVAENVEYTIAMEGEIPVDSAILFSKTFYENLYKGQPIYIAFDRTIDDLNYYSKKREFKPVLKLKNYYIMEKIVFENQDLFNHLPVELHEQVKEIKRLWLNTKNEPHKKSLYERLINGHSFPFITMWFIENTKVLSRKISEEILDSEDISERNKLSRQIEIYFNFLWTIIVNMDGKEIFDSNDLENLPYGRFDKDIFFKAFDKVIYKATKIFKNDEPSIYFLKERIDFLKGKIELYTNPS
jgi:hypothetical protein